MRLFTEAFMREAMFRSAGYDRLISQFELSVVPNWHKSVVARGNSRQRDRNGDQVLGVYPASQWPGDSAVDHLEFALKYDGTNLQVLSAIFDRLPVEDLVNYVRSTPLGKYVRRAWYLYEWCTGRELPLPPVGARVGYVPLLESDEQYTAVGRPIVRQRVIDNLLGSRAFCPTVRRTARLAEGEAARLDERGRQVVADCPAEVLRRAMHYLYTKETRSSFEIEHEQPTADRVERFVSLLHTAERDDYVNRAKLVELQNQIVDPRFREADYRRSQNYVGQTVQPGYEKLHFIPPRPADVTHLMGGLVACHRAMETAAVHPVVHAAVVAYGFVFIHPFEDGNGRSHRFLIHNVLARRSFTPPGLIFPVSAVMLKDASGYDRSLEAFSGPLRPPLINYHLDDRGRLTVENDTGPLYQFMDLTAQVEALFDFVRTTIDHDLAGEIDFLRRYDAAKRNIQAVADVPDRLIDLFIRCWIHNHGKLSKRKRETTFARLTDDEVSRMTDAVARASSGNVEGDVED